MMQRDRTTDEVVWEILFRALLAMRITQPERSLQQDTKPSQFSPPTVTASTKAAGWARPTPKPCQGVAPCTTSPQHSQA
jgi:hypothetical protein